MGSEMCIRDSGVIVIAILSLIAAFRYYWRNRWEDEYALTPALITICFWIMACGEGMMAPIGGAINLSFLVIIGLVSLAPTPNTESSEYETSHLHTDTISKNSGR